MKVVRKKILPKYFVEVVEKNKNFELRKDDDDIQVGDKLILSEWNGNCYTGKSVTRTVIARGLLYHWVVVYALS